MRTAWLVTYDVCDARRLRRVYQVMRRFGDHLQLSVFRCVLGDREMIRLRAELSAELNLKEDQVLFANLGPEEGRGSKSIEGLGKQYTHPERHVVVV